MLIACTCKKHDVKKGYDSYDGLLEKPVREKKTNPYAYFEVYNNYTRTF